MTDKAYALNPDDIIHVVMCLYDPSGTYSQHAGVVLTSMFENTRSRVTVHLFHDDTLTEDNRSKFIRTAEKFSQELQFHDITGRRDILDGIPPEVFRDFTIGATFRAFVPELLADLDKVIYLDCDVIVNLDIKELWNIDLHGKSLAGVRDVLAYVSPWSLNGSYVRLSGCRNDSYINSGVLVMNLTKIRKLGKFSAIFTAWLLRNAHLYTWGDQSALNAIFRDDIELIDPRFNFWKLNTDISGCIFHMCCGSGKAWTQFTGEEHQRLYWEIHLRTEWGKDMTPLEMLNTISGLVRSPECRQHYHTRAGMCVKRVLRSVVLRLHNFNPFHVLWLEISDKFRRIKRRLANY